MCSTIASVQVTGGPPTSVNVNIPSSEGFTRVPDSVTVIPMQEPWLFLAAIGLCVFGCYLLASSVQLEEWVKPKGLRVPSSRMGVALAYLAAAGISIVGMIYVTHLVESDDPLELLLYHSRLVAPVLLLAVLPVLGIALVKLLGALTIARQGKSPALAKPASRATISAIFAVLALAADLVTLFLFFG